MAAAVHAARASPPHLQTMHSVLPPNSSFSMTHPPPHVLPPNTMDRKHLLPLNIPDGAFPSLPFYPLPPPPPPPPPVSLPQSAYDEEIVDEDIDEDDMSDLEEELQQELLAYRKRQLEPDMTRQLLSFADRVNADIHRFFGRKKGDEDSCDVYEDKWTVTKSGRELYYADLLRIAQGDFGDGKSSSSRNSEKSSRHKDMEVLVDNRHSFSGKADMSLGLGPLKELFEHGLQTGRQKKGSSLHSAAKRQRTETESTVSKSLPMHQRPFPDSFWREPGLNAAGSVGTSSLDIPVMTPGVVQSLGAGKLPDFSDLMDSWHGDQSHLQHQQQLHTLQPVHHQHHQHRPAAIDSTSTSSDLSRKRRL